MNQTAVKNHFWGVWFDDCLLMWNYWFINPTTVADHFISGANWAEIYSLSSYLSFGTHKHICLESSRHLRFYNVFLRLVEHDSSTNSKQRDILSLFLYTLVFWLINQMLLFTLCYLNYSSSNELFPFAVCLSHVPLFINIFPSPLLMVMKCCVFSNCVCLSCCHKTSLWQSFGILEWHTRFALDGVFCCIVV